MTVGAFQTRGEVGDASGGGLERTALSELFDVGDECSMDTESTERQPVTGGANNASLTSADRPDKVSRLQLS